MSAINEPIYCLTSDIDWASDYCIHELLDLTRRFGVTPTLFATHASAALTEFAREHPDHIGVHPNFRDGSTHGSDHRSVIQHVFGLYPTAKTFRAHCFFDSSDILQEMSRRGIRYDSNLCLYLQPDIVPLRLGIPGITRFPVFWEDDVHWMHTGGDWQLSNCIDAFASPGLKIINVHPFMLAANVPSNDWYLKVKKHIATASRDDIETIRQLGAGPRTFLIDLIEFVRSQGRRFYTLREIHEAFPVGSLPLSEDENKGRHTAHSDEEYRRYRQMSDAEKQQFIRGSYERRDATDKYATSRDHHARELEIQALARGLGTRGAVLDLGCGNGYTLLSLAKRFKDWTLTGVDFVENLIEGAKQLAVREAGALQSQPTFVCADAVHYLDGLPDGSVEYVVSERFIQNLPSVEWQKRVIQKIHRVLAKDGRLLLCEGSSDGFRALNDVRHKLGLSLVPETSADNVSAIRIQDGELESYVQSELGFRIVSKFGFSQYFLISRVLHPLMVAPLAPRFDSRFNDLARSIQEHTAFTPGYGSNVLWVLEK